MKLKNIGRRMKEGIMGYNPKKMNIDISIKQLQQLACSLYRSNCDEFRQLANLTALRKAADVTYYLGNWWRGPLDTQCIPDLRNHFYSSAQTKYYMIFYVFFR